MKTVSAIGSSRDRFLQKFSCPRRTCPVAGRRLSFALRIALPVLTGQVMNFIHPLQVVRNLDCR